MLPVVGFVAAKAAVISASVSASPDHWGLSTWTPVAQSSKSRAAEAKDAQRGIGLGASAVVTWFLVTSAPDCPAHLRLLPSAMLSATRPLSRVIESDSITMVSWSLIHVFGCGFEAVGSAPGGASLSATAANLVPGESLTVVFVQNQTTACTWAWPTNFHGGGTVTTTPGGISAQQFIVSANGTDAYATSPMQSTTGGNP